MNLLFAALIFTSFPAAAEDWEYAGMPESLAGALAVDVASITSPTPSTREATVVMVLREDRGKLAAVVSRMTIDCPAKSKRAQWAKGYDASGNYLQSEGEEADWFPMAEDTPYGVIHDRACNGPGSTRPEHFGSAVPVAELRARIEDAVSRSGD